MRVEQLSFQHDNLVSFACLCKRLVVFFLAWINQERISKQIAVYHYKAGFVGGYCCCHGQSEELKFLLIRSTHHRQQSTSVIVLYTPLIIQFVHSHEHVLPCLSFGIYSIRISYVPQQMQGIEAIGLLIFLKFRIEVNI